MQLYPAGQNYSFHQISDMIFTTTGSVFLAEIIIMFNAMYYDFLFLAVSNFSFHLKTAFCLLDYIL